MSDTFDHWEDAFESQYNDDPYGYEEQFSKNPLYYHRKYSGIKLMHSSDKSYLIAFANGSTCWVAKKLCRHMTETSVYIWEGAELHDTSTNVTDLGDDEGMDNL